MLECSWLWWFWKRYDSYCLTKTVTMTGKNLAIFDRPVDSIVFYFAVAIGSSKNLT